MKRCKILLTIIFTVGLIGTAGLLGCEKKDGEGALERAGKAADEAAEKATTQAADAVEKVGDALDQK